MATIAIDSRMIAHSGIGTCLVGWLTDLIKRREDWSFVLLGNPALLASYQWSLAPNVFLDRFVAPIYGVTEQFCWLNKVRGRSFDLLWVPHYTIPLYWPGRLMVTIHDIAHFALPEVFGGLKRAYASAFLSRVAARATGVTFVSEFTAREFGKFFGPPRGISRVVYNGVSEEWFKADSSPKVPLQRPYMVAVGNVKPHKNLSRLILAFLSLRARLPHDLLIVGKEDGFITGDSSVRRHAADSGGRIRFTGWLTDEELMSLVSRADLLIQPSIYEGFGLPPLEAMAAGCPVAVSNCSALPEVCGGAAAYFDPHDVSSIASVVEAVLRDGAKRSIMVQEGRMRARQFSWGASSRGVESLMLELLECPGPGIKSRGVCADDKGLSGHGASWGKSMRVG